MAPRIEEYEFGRIKIAGRDYRNDVIITPDGVRPEWWRKDGHGLVPEDLDPVIFEVSPEALIIGRGYNGALTVPEDTKAWVEGKGVELIALPSRDAVDRYNELAGKSRVMAGLHLTC